MRFTTCCRHSRHPVHTPSETKAKAGNTRVRRVNLVTKVRGIQFAHTVERLVQVALDKVLVHQHLYSLFQLLYTRVRLSKLLSLNTCSRRKSAPITPQSKGSRA